MPERECLTLLVVDAGRLKLKIMSSRFRSFLQILVSVLLIWILFGRLDRSSALETIGRVNVIGLTILFFLYSADRVLMAWKWELLLRSRGQRIGIYNAVKLYYVSCFMGFALPLGGIGPDIVRFVQTRELGLESKEVFGSIVVERFLGLIATLVMLFLSAGILWTLLPEIPFRKLLPMTLAGVGAATTFSLAVVFSRDVQGAIGRLFQRWGKSRDRGAGKYLDAIGAYAGIRPVLAWFLGLAILEQLLSVFIFHVTAGMLGLKLGALETLGVVPIAFFVQRLPISYAGLGVREGAYVALLSLFGVDYADALVLSLTMFAIFVLSLLPGSVWSLFAIRSWRQNSSGH